MKILTICIKILVFLFPFLFQTAQAEPIIKTETPISVIVKGQTQNGYPFCAEKVVYDDLEEHAETFRVNITIDADTEAKTCIAIYKNTQWFADVKNNLASVIIELPEEELNNITVIVL